MITQLQAEFAKVSLSEVFTPEGDAGHVLGSRVVYSKNRERSGRFNGLTSKWLVEVEAYGSKKFYQPAVITPSQALIKLLMRDYPKGHPTDCLRCEGCVNPWHGTSTLRAVQSCPECPPAARDSATGHLYYPASLPNEHRYRAFNGHMMAAHVQGYKPDGSMAYEQFSAWHADDCHCDGQETLPNW